ncbi:MAG: Zinc protease [Actinobacteria bacterium]|nr:Zinc protease [Actinomycetota bacterium]
MSRKTFTALMAGWILLAALAAGATSAPEEAKLIEKYKLRNGLTVVIRENRSSPVVAVQVWVKAGSTSEPENRAGMSHILEHMAFKGTKKRGPGQLAREVEALGGEINAYTSFDQTVYHITISKRYLENALEILSDTLGNSVFDAGELAREKEVILEELRMNEDDPGRIVWKALFREAYTVHPYGRPVIGYADTIRKTGRKDLVSYFSKHYHPGNMVLLIVGDVDPKAARPLIEKTFSPLKSRATAKRKIPAEPPQKAVRVKIQEWDAKRAYLEIGFPGPSMKSKDVFAFDLFSSILGDGETSRLYREVKDRRGLVDSVGSGSYTPKDPGLLMVRARGSTKKSAEALREILVQVYRMTAGPPEGGELARAKTQTESGFLYSLESQSSLAGHIGSFEVTLGDAAFERKYLKAIRAVTAEDVAAVAKKYIRPERLNVSIIVPKGDEGALTDETVRKIAAEAWTEATAPKVAKAGSEASTVKKVVLPNGIRVIVRESRAVPVVAVEAGFMAGLRAEPAEKNGISVMTAEMLTKGTSEIWPRAFRDFPAGTPSVFRESSCGRISSGDSASSPSRCFRRPSHGRSLKKNAWRFLEGSSSRRTT